MSEGGPGGKNVKTTRKKHYFECEVGPSGRGILRQTILLNITICYFAEG